MADPTTLFKARGDKKALEQGSDFAPKFDAQGLIPVVATDHQTGEVLMFAFMNAETLAMTIELGEAVYWSRSRSEIWHKGKTSGNVQRVVELRTDCDQDAIWLRVDQQGGAACHTGRRTCFYRAYPTGEKFGADAALEIVEKDILFDPEKVYGKK